MWCEPGAPGRPEREEKMEKRVEGGREGRSERGKGAPGRAGSGAGAGEELLPRGKGRAMEEQAKGGDRGREKKNWLRVKERDGR